MAKLYFRYGTVGSAKTLNLLAVAHNYELQSKKILLLKPRMDNRFGDVVVKSRAGLYRDADYLLTDQSVIRLEGRNLALRPEAASDHEGELIDLDQHEGVSCLLVDEAQFLSRSLIDQLQLVSVIGNIPVICYGLKSNFRSELFEGSRRLLEIADSLDEIKSTCFYCNRKALFNLKFQNGVPTVDGPEVELGTEEIYKPACKYCFRQAMEARSDRNTFQSPASNAPRVSTHH